MTRALLLALALLAACTLEPNDEGGAALTGEGTQVTCAGDDCLCQAEAECAIDCVADDQRQTCAPTCEQGSACTVGCGGFETCAVSCGGATTCTVDCAQASQCEVVCPTEGCTVRNCDLLDGCAVTCAGGGAAAENGNGDVVCGSADDTGR